VATVPSSSTELPKLGKAAGCATANPANGFEGIGWPVLSMEGRIAYNAWTAGREFVVVGGDRGPDFDEVRPPNDPRRK
jgi:hypothetical protein